MKKPTNKAYKRAINDELESGNLPDYLIRIVNFSLQFNHPDSELKHLLGKLKKVNKLVE